MIFRTMTLNITMFSKRIFIIMRFSRIIRTINAFSIMKLDIETIFSIMKLDIETIFSIMTFN